MTDENQPGPAPENGNTATGSPELLCVSVLSTGREKIASALIEEILQRGCAIVESRITPMANGLGAQFVCSGNWSSLGRLETALPGLARQLDIQVQHQRTQPREPQPDMRPYAVEVVAPQRRDLLPSLLQFFGGFYIEVAELVAQQYDSTHTGAGMCNLQFVLHVPSTQHPPALREAFMDLCDDLNADGMMDPIKT